jgi:hypothetical protein
MSQFQSTINVFNPLGFVGNLAFQGPTRAIAANIASSGTPNLFGNAYTFSAAATADPAAGAPNGATAQVGGTGVFAGILIGRQQNVLNGTTGNPLGATLALADNSVGELLQMGYAFVSLPGPANPGDLVTFDTTLGNLNSIPPLALFTGAIAAGGSAGVPDVLTVTLMQAGTLGVGSIISGAGVETATILSLGSGLGGNGTYNISTINQQTVSAVAMSAPNVAPAAFVGLASFATSVMTVGTATSGQLVIGQQIFGTGVPANTVITSFGTGAGGTGTYNLNNTVGTLGSRAVTAPANTIIKGCTVERYATNTSGGGVAVIRLTQ